MQFKVLNNKLIQFVRPGVALYNPRHYDELVVYPISRITSLALVDRYVAIEFTPRKELIKFETQEGAKQAFHKLIDILGNGSLPRVKNDGPSPDLWALEQLQ
jgi:hypothetical protein